MALIDLAQQCANEALDEFCTADPAHDPVRDFLAVADGKPVHLVYSQRLGLLICSVDTRPPPSGTNDDHQWTAEECDAIQATPFYLFESALIESIGALEWQNELEVAYTSGVREPLRGLTKRAVWLRRGDEYAVIEVRWMPLDGGG